VFSVTNAGKLVERLLSGDLPTVLFFSIDLYGFSLEVSPQQCMFNNPGDDVFEKLGKICFIPGSHV